MAPIIGITTSGLNEQMVQSSYYDQYYIVPDLYVEAVRRAGGIPILLPPGEVNIEQVLKLVDGIIISGGGDIDPSRYGGNVTHPTLTRVDENRDTFEIGIIQHAMQDQDTPVLCVCRGMQVLNVALGGTMVEHIPDIQDEDPHRSADGFWTVHEISVNPNSKLAQIMGTNTVETYSGHHQSVKAIADDLSIVATAPDNIVEGLEAASHPWMIGVQWHPEKSAARDATQQALFDALVAAASEEIQEMGEEVTETD